MILWLASPHFRLFRVIAYIPVGKSLRKDLIEYRFLHPLRRRMNINGVQVWEFEQPQVLCWRAFEEPSLREPYALTAFRQEETVGQPSILRMYLCLPIVK
ncbi:hypothetical protein D3C72_1538310 [compost metagenome]